MSVLAQRQPEVRVIKPASRWAGPNLRELWHFRELLYFLTVRDLKVRYKQTFLGVIWAILQPVMYMIVFTLFFSKVAHLYTAGQAYAPLTLTGSVIWLFFANSVTLGSASLVGNANLITKVYFPRVLAPVGPVLASVIDLMLSSVVMLGIMAGYGYYPAPRIVVAVPFVLLALGTAVGVSAWLSALNVKYRDVRYVVPFLLQLWMFASSVFYSVAALRLHQPWNTIYWFNPMAGVVEGFRWSLLGGTHPTYSHVAISTAGGLVLLAAGLLYFRRKEREFADIV